MKDKEIEIINKLLDREIEHLKSVYERTQKVYWLEKIEEIEETKRSLNLTIHKALTGNIIPPSPDESSFPNP